LNSSILPQHQKAPPLKAGMPARNALQAGVEVSGLSVRPACRTGRDFSLRVKGSSGL